MSENTAKAFEAIQEFVSEIWDVYGNPEKYSPLNLYHRLVVKHVEVTDPVGLEKVLSGFKLFFEKYEKCIIEDNLDAIDRGARIVYGTTDTAYLDIQKFIHKADDDVKSVIRVHLLTISTLLDPNPEKLGILSEKNQELQDEMDPFQLGIDTSTKEGALIGNMMNSVAGSMKDIDATNPAQAITSLLSSGSVMKMFAEIQLNSDEIDPQKLFGTVQGILGNLAGPEAQNPVSVEKIEEVD